MTSRHIPLDTLLPQLGLTDLAWAQRRVLRLVREGTIEPTDFSVSRHGEIKRGQPRRVYALSRLGAFLFAMGVRTTQAAEWRRLQAERLDALVEANVHAALPAASVDHDVRQKLHDLEWRMQSLEEGRLAIACRVEKLEARVPKQLALPMAIGVDHVAAHAAFVAAFEKLQTAVNGPNPARGVTTTDIFDLIQAGHVAALELREAIKALNGGRFPSSAISLGKCLQRACSADGPFTSQWTHGHVRRWVVAAKGVH